MPSQAAVAEQAEDLRANINGQVILPGDDGYEQARLAWNLTVVQHPAIIVMARGADDIAAAVQFAVRNDLGIAVQSTGHGNIRPADDCLLILTQEMQEVRLNPVTQTAWVEAGVKWGAVLAAAQEHGLAPLLGSSPGVGAVGYTLGGGLGWLARKYGLAADSVIRLEVVTPDGLLRRCSAEENTDLFWGLRGGGGTLAVVTGMEIKLHPVTTVYAGNLFYPATMAREVFRRYRGWIARAPVELTSSVLIMNFPPLPQMPEFLRGQSFAIVRGCYCGDAAKGNELLKYWRDWQAPLMDEFKEIPFSLAATISNDPEGPLPGYSSGAWLSRLSDEAIETLITYALGKDGPPRMIFAEVRHIGGAVSAAPAGTNAYGNRQAELLLSIIAMTPTREIKEQAAAYVGQMKAALGPDLTRGVYLNFLEGSESPGRVRDGLAPGAYERLAALKARYDPDNRLRYALNIPPVG